jgi:hypothetical protein
MISALKDSSVLATQLSTGELGRDEKFYRNSLAIETILKASPTSSTSFSYATDS